MTDEDGNNNGPDQAKADNDTPKVEPPPHHQEHTSETQHKVRVGRRSIAYTATAGRMLLKEEEGKKQASFFYVAYTRDGVEDIGTRPIVFAFNGGPGSSSVWLHLGILGPRRVVLSDDGEALPPPGRLENNEHTLLDVADLVFIDPVSTGFSRAIPEEDAKNFHHFKKDIESVGEFIRLYLTRYGRWGSPKFLAGESYGTLRSAGVAGHLLDRHGIAFNGLMLISSILNYQTTGFDPKTWTFRRGNDLPYTLFLPTYAATAWYHKRLPRDLQRKRLRAVLDEVEAFAATEYTLALAAGERLDADEFDAIAERVARYTGLDKEYVAYHDLRIEILRFCKELLRDTHRTVGRLDSRYTGMERFKAGQSLEHDPSLDAVTPSYTSALNDYMKRDLDYDSDLPYEILSGRVQPWSFEDFQNAYVDTSETLRETMSRNRFMGVYVASGYFDLATPHFATEYTLNHLGLDPEIRGNIAMAHYEAGHMMYVHEPSLRHLASDLRRFVGDNA